MESTSNRFKFVLQRKIGQDLEHRYVAQDHHDVISKVALFHAKLTQHRNRISIIENLYKYICV